MTVHARAAILFTIEADSEEFALQERPNIAQIPGDTRCTYTWDIFEVLLTSRGCTFHAQPLHAMQNEVVAAVTTVKVGPSRLRAGVASSDSANMQVPSI